MFRVGQQIGIYTLIKQLGRGGFGEVWLAERRTKFVTTQVAVKLPLDEQVNYAAIEQEAQLWAQASGHANILPIIEANEYDGQIVIVSEYAVDGSLEGLLLRNGGVLPTKSTIEMIVGILKGLEYLHSRKIIHRDIKPANILLQGDTPRLADFGLSRLLKSTSLASSVVGTPYYMAPEAFRGKRNAQTDVWSVGVVLYEMLKGELPFSGDDITDLFGAIMFNEPAPLPDSIPLRLQDIVRKALSKEIAERYQTAREMREELEESWPRISLPVKAHSSPISVQSQESLAVIKKGEHIAPELLVSTLEISQQGDEIDKSNVAPDTRFVLSPVSPTVEAKPNRLYFAILVVMLLLFVIIGGGYLLGDGTADNAAANNTNSPPATTASPSAATDPLFIPFHKGKKIGFSDVNKKLVIEAKYDDVSQFRDGLASVKLKGKWGIIDKTGKEVSPIKYDDVFPFSEGLANVKLNGKYGCIDKTGKEIIPPKYYYMDWFSEGLAKVILNENGKGGFVDPTGKEVISLKYTVVGSFREGLASVKLNGKWGFIDKTGETVIPSKYDLADAFSEGLAMVKLNGKYGFIDKTGKEVIPLEYTGASTFDGGLAPVELLGKIGFIDKTGQVVIPIKYEEASWFRGGPALVQLNGKYSFIDKTGKEIISVKYDRAFWFSDGLASVELNGKYGYIDKTGKEVIPIKYDKGGWFSEGLALVQLNGREFYIDKNGTEYYEP